MIKQLRIQNFRSHKNTKLEFVKGVNCIIGLPDSGKTNIIRAINWILTNRPLGFRFHSNFTKDPTAVDVDFEDGHQITLIKTKSESGYVCNEKEFRAIGSDVPDEVSRISNITELNLQTQMDKPFLICESPGEVAKVFNRISKLEKPDLVIASLTTDINSKNKQAKALLLEKTELEESLKKFKNLPQMKDDLDEIEKIEDRKQKIKNGIDELFSIIDNIEAVKKIMENMIDVDKARKELENINKFYSEIFNKQIKYTALQDIITSAEEVEDKMQNMKMNYKDIQKDFGKFLKTIKICPYCEKCKEPISTHNLDKFVKAELA
jgi:DNA repair protein SbcC/Rad50